MPGFRSSIWDALASDVHVVALDDDLVFLDVAKDRYVCLPGAAAWARPDRARLGLTVRDRALAAELRRGGLTSPIPPDRSPWSPPPPATASGQSLVAQGPLRRDLPEMALAMWDLFATYRGRTLATLVGTTAPREVPGAAAPAVGRPLEAVVDGFHRWAPYAPTSAKCLLRAYMLRRLLRRQGYDAQWVFGVRTWPFEAHCWLQVGGLVLDDDVDRVTAFEPILVV